MKLENLYIYLFAASFIIFIISIFYYKSGKTAVLNIKDTYYVTSIFHLIILIAVIILLFALIIFIYSKLKHN